MSGNIVPPVLSGSDLEGRAQPTDSTVGRSDPQVVPPPRKSPILLFITLTLLAVVSVFAIYLFLQVRTLTLEKSSPTPTPIPVASVNPIQVENSYVCPPNGWQDCMPILSEEGQKACSEEAMQWYQSNCPDFQGAAL